MSVALVTRVRCDWRGCRAQTYVRAASIPDALARAAAMGWTRVRVGGGRHLERCPTHRAQAAR